MKRIILLSIMASILIVGFVPSANADMAMEGSGNYKDVYSFTCKTLPMGKERLQMTVEGVGVVVEAPANSPFHNATFYLLGALHAIKGVFNNSGFIRYTCPNKDTIFATYTGSGELNVAKKVTYTFVGGTGQYAGIDGGAELTGEGKGFLSPTKSDGIGMSMGKVHWKIPQKKK